MNGNGGIIEVCILPKKLQVGTFSHFLIITQLSVSFHRKIETYVQKITVTIAIKKLFLFTPFFFEKSTETQRKYFF